MLKRLEALETQVGKGEVAETEALRAEVATHIGTDGAAELSVNALKATLAKFKPAADVATGNLAVNRGTSGAREFKPSEMPE